MKYLMRLVLTMVFSLTFGSAWGKIYEAVYNQGDTYSIVVALVIGVASFGLANSICSAFEE